VVGGELRTAQRHRDGHEGEQCPGRLLREGTEAARPYGTRGEQAPIVRDVIEESLMPLQRETQKREKAATSTTAEPGKATPVREIVGFMSYPILMIVFGALVGGSLWGMYWVVSGLFGRMHAEESFAALRIKNYKNFLRMQFEEDTLTIYPIALDRVPGAKDWRQWEEKTDASKRHKPLIVPKGDMTPRLIETPIKIERKRSALEI
jgi:hypothetical protein